MFGIICLFSAGVLLGWLSHIPFLNKRIINVNKTIDDARKMLDLVKEAIEENHKINEALECRIEKYEKLKRICFDLLEKIP